ncbi:MAG: YceI family protein [Flavobacterium sp.]|jgi:polyisoprenoid-binding protein YceI|nr:YceI family protein [Flavobacterium sp.]
MRKLILSCAVIALVSFTSCKKENTENVGDSATETTAVGVYNLDVSNSKIDWVGSKPAGKHTGTLTLTEGNFEVTEGNITGGTFTIDMNSITVTDLSGDDKMYLETHLKGTGDKESEDHFFNVNKYPTATFTVSSVEKVENNHLVKGNLTVKDITNAVEFTAQVTTTDSTVTLVSNPFKINRTKWNVTYASKSLFDDLKDKFVDDDIELVVKVSATK